MSAIENRIPRLADRTPLDWRELLLVELAEQAEDALFYEAYYRGDHPLAFASTKFLEAFGNLFEAFADNWCQIVVDASVERLQIVGFEIDGEANEAAWELWQRNALDVESVIAHTEAGKAGRAFLLVDPNDGEPLITVEHASQMVVVTDPANRRRRLAALKRWLGDDGFVNVTVYLPEVVLKFESEKPVDEQRGFGQLEWVARDEGELPNTLGVVPVIPLENKPGLLGRPHSDLEPAIPIQNAVNKLCTDLLVASEYGAFPQRVITGWEAPKDPETGAPLFSAADRKVALEAAMSRAWTFGDADVRASSLPAADLSNFTTAIDLFIQHLAAQTRTPPHYLLGQVVNASGDALSVAEAGLVSKCRTKALFFSDPWEEAIALALTAAGTETIAASCETLWADPERQTQAQLTDAATKKKALGIPLDVILGELGYTPEQIARMLDEIAAEPPPPPPPAPPALPGEAPPQPTPPTAPIEPQGGTGG